MCASAIISPFNTTREAEENPFYFSQYLKCQVYLYNFRQEIVDCSIFIF